MKGYVMMIAGGAILSAFADIMAPSEWKKYIRIITGFILLAVIMSPASRLSSLDLFDENFSAEQIEYTPMPEMITQELEKRVAEDAQTRILTEYGTDCEIHAYIRTNSEGLIEKVERLTVKTNSTNTEEIGKRLYEVYGADRIEFIRQG